MDGCMRDKLIKDIYDKMINIVKNSNTVIVFNVLTPNKVTLPQYTMTIADYENAGYELNRQVFDVQKRRIPAFSLFISGHHNMPDGDHVVLSAAALDQNNGDNEIIRAAVALSFGDRGVAAAKRIIAAAAARCRK